LNASVMIFSISLSSGFVSLGRFMTWLVGFARCTDLHLWDVLMQNLHLWNLLAQILSRRCFFSSGPNIIVIVDVDVVVVAEGFHEASISSLMGARQKILPSRVVGPLVCSTSPSWQPLMIESPTVLSVVDIVTVAEVDVRC
jgi:hypothetical protein